MSCAADGDPCGRAEPAAVPPRFRPVLPEGPVSQVAPYDPPTPPLGLRRRCIPALGGRRPAVALDGVTPQRPRATGSPRPRPARSRSADDAHFVVEVEARRPRPPPLRRRPQRPAPERRAPPSPPTTASATAPSATSARDAHRPRGDRRSATIIARAQPAAGAAAASSPRRWRRCARPRPYAYRRQERAVTPEDYAEVALPPPRRPARRRHLPLERPRPHRLRHRRPLRRPPGHRRSSRPSCVDFLDRFRMAGYDLEIDGPRFVPLELDALRLRRARPLPLRGPPRRAARRSSAGAPARRRARLLPPRQLQLRPARLPERDLARGAGDRGRRARSAPPLFRRRGQPDPTPLLDGVLPIGRLEIAQLENDPNFPERGTLTVEMGGGK